MAHCCVKRIRLPPTWPEFRQNVVCSWFFLSCSESSFSPVTPVLSCPKNSKFQILIGHLKQWRLITIIHFGLCFMCKFGNPSEVKLTKTLFCIAVVKWCHRAITMAYRAFSHDVTAAILVFKDNEMAAIGAPNQSCGSWTLFLCKSFHLFQKIYIDASHVRENVPFNLDLWIITKHFREYQFKMNKINTPHVWEDIFFWQLCISWIVCI